MVTPLKIAVSLSLLQLWSCQGTDFYQKTVTANSETPGPGSGTDEPRIDFPPGDDTNTGGTSGGSTSGGSTSGGTSGGGAQEYTENFQQNAAEYANVDILWVVDNSGSMADEQASLISNFNSFIRNFLDEEIQFQMAITTTDARAQYNGLPVAGSLADLTYANAVSNQADFISDFNREINVGINGSGYEKGLQTSEGFFTNHAAGWLRPEAYLAVIYVSDEEDQSISSVQHYVDFLKSLKSDPNKVKAHAIVDTLNRGGSGLTVGSLRYQEAANSTSGSIHDITSNFGDSLETIAEQIVNLTLSFVLAHPADESTIEVLVNGVVNTAWTYDATTHSVRFASIDAPLPGATISISYTAL